MSGAAVPVASSGVDAAHVLALGRLVDIPGS